MPRPCMHAPSGVSITSTPGTSFLNVMRSLALICMALVFFGFSTGSAEAAMSPLVESVLAEDTDGARAALDAGASPNALDPELQRSALHIAVSPGAPRNAAMVELLASRGADLNAEDARTKLTPLMTAIIVADTSGPFAVLEFQKSKLIVERLLSLGADAGRATQGGETPLLVAVSAGNIEVLNLLIARGAKPDQAGDKGETALARATKLKRQDMINALLMAGAKPIASASQFAARGVGDVVEADADTAPATPATTGAAATSSGVSGWFIGGLAVAAGVVAAAVAANNAKNRRNAQNAQQQAQSQPQLQPQPAPPQLTCAAGYVVMNGTCQVRAPECALPLVLRNGECVPQLYIGLPKPIPVPPSPCAAPLVLQNGLCVALPVARVPVQIFDGVYSSTRTLADGFTHTERITVSDLSVSAHHTFTNGSASGSFDWTGTIAQTGSDRGTLSGSGTITNLGTRAFTLLQGSSIGRNPSGTMTINWSGNDPRFGGIGWTSERGNMVTIQPYCGPPQVLQNGHCVVPGSPACVAPQVLQNGQCVAPPIVACAPPRMLQNGLCVAPPITACLASQVLQNGVCVTPPPTVVPPLSIVNASPVDLASLLRIALNDGPGNVTVNWTRPASVVVTDVAIAYTWSCASGPRIFVAHATPAANAGSAVVPWFSNSTGIGCPEFAGAGPGNAPTSAIISLTYKVNGTGPDLVVSKPYGQVACLTFFPDQAAFPINVTVNETWNNGANYQFNRQLANPYGLASFYGLDDVTLNNVFRSCNGRFISASGSKVRAPTAADAQLYTDTMQAYNGMLTLTEQVTRPGAAISENVIFTYRYSIATGEYSLTTAGGQRNATGGSSVANASRTGRVKVRVEVSSPQDAGFVAPPPAFNVSQPPVGCGATLVLQNGVCVPAVVIPSPLLVCAAPQVMQNGACVVPPPTVCTAPQVLQNGVCVVPAGNRLDRTPRTFTFVSGGIRPQYFLWQMYSKIVKIDLPKISPPVWGTVELSGIGTTMLMATVKASGYPPGSQYFAGSILTHLDVDVTVEPPAPAGSSVPPNNYTELVSMSQNITFGSTAPQVFSQKLKSKIVRIFDVNESPLFGGTVRYEGVGTDTLVITVNAGGAPGSSRVNFTAQVMY